MSAIVKPSWLASALRAKDAGVAVLDCSWFLPNEGRDVRAEFADKRIPTARFFDIDEIATSNDVGLMHMMPTPEILEEAMDSLGISSDQHVVCYDSAGIYSAPRVWFTLSQVFGQRASVLDGGLPQWERQELPLERGPPPPTPKKKPNGSTKQYRVVSYHPDRVLNQQEVLDWIRNDSGQIVDARVKERFLGAVDEPRPSQFKGHLRGAVNVPYNDLSVIDQVVMTTDERPVLTYCGSGLSACVINLALHERGHRQHFLYDGSSAEFLNSETMKGVTTTEN